MSARSAAVSSFFFPSAMTSSPSSTNPHHALARLRPGLDVEQAEALLEPLDLGFGLLQMRLEQLLQLLGVGRLHHFGKRLLNLLLGMQDVAQLIDEQLLDHFPIRRFGI